MSPEQADFGICDTKKCTQLPGTMRKTTEDKRKILESYSHISTFLSLSYPSHFLIFSKCDDFLKAFASIWGYMECEVHC